MFTEAMFIIIKNWKQSTCNQEGLAKKTVVGSYSGMRRSAYVGLKNPHDLFSREKSEHRAIYAT